MGNLSLAEKRSYSTAYVQYMQKVLNMYAFYQLYIKQAVPEEFSATVTINEESKTIKSQDVTDVMETAKSISGRLKNYQSNFNSYTRYRSYLLNLSSSQFTRIFKKEVGAAPWEYILKKRLLNARQLLKNGFSTQVACEKSGFFDYSAFYRSYTKCFKEAPGETRKG